MSGPVDRPVLPHGTWPSPVDPEVCVAAAVRLADVRSAGGDLWWVEQRPAEDGRSVLVRHVGGATADVTPAGTSVRSRVHEYGGTAYAVGPDGSVVWVDDPTQALWHRRPDGTRRRVPVGAADGSDRWAEPVFTPDGRWVVAVGEHHSGDGSPPVNRLEAVRLDDGTSVVLDDRADFVAAPRLSPDGGWLAWITWDLPDMPWDATRLWVAPLEVTDDRIGLGEPVLVAGDDGGTSVLDPEWGPDGHLWFSSDRTGWWNPWRWRPGAPAAPVVRLERESAGPLWALGSRWGACDPTGGRWVVLRSEAADRLARVRPDGTVSEVEVPDTEISSLVPHGDGVAYIGAGPTHEPEVVTVAADGTRRVIRPGRPLPVDRTWISVPRHVSFPTPDGKEAHALHYPPCNPLVRPPEGEPPPVVVMSHGGPTGAARRQLDLTKQLFTSRGFAVIDVDYRGSTGYGRAYRRALDGRWGVVDPVDCAAAVAHLAAGGHVDPARAAIRGGSAGGFTTLCALVFGDGFAVGASWYGVADLEALATDTHKFESRYLDRLVGPWPEAAEVYRARSPIHHLDRLRAPVIVFQGSEDRVVPPNQAEALVAALAARGIPHEYHLFEGEGHGFRRAETIRTALSAELRFVGRILGVDVAVDG